MTRRQEHQDDLTEWTALLDTCATGRSTGSLTLSAAAVADRLCRDGAWLRGCAAAAAQSGGPLLDGSPLTGPPEDGPVAAALRLLRDKAPTRNHPMARAIWHAARAAVLERGATPCDRALADAETAAAAVWCEAARHPSPSATAGPALLVDVEQAGFRATHPELPWKLAGELVERCLHGPRRRHESVAAKVLADGITPDGTAVLTVDLVQDAAEDVLPDADTMLFTTGLESLEASLAAAFSWGRAQEHFPRGHGMRWRLGGPHHVAAAIPAGTEVGAAAAVALARALHRRRGGVFTRAGEHPHDADPRVVVHAAIRPPARLYAVPAPADAVHDALAAGHILLFAPGDGDARPVIAAPRDQVREARDVTQALRRSRRLPRRFVAASCAFTVIVTMFGLWYGGESRERADRDRIATKAEELADRALQRETRTPDQALVDALTARALAPDSPGSRDALLSAVNRETSISKVIRTKATGLHSLALSHNGRYVAGIDSKRRLWVWDARKASPVSVPTELRKVNTIGFPQTDGALAVATDQGVARWDPAGDGGPQWRTDTPATAVAYSADGTRLAIGGRDGTVEVQDTGSSETGRRTLLADDGRPTTLAFTTSGSTLAIGTATAVRMWDWRTTARPQRAATDLPAPARNLLYAARCKCFYALSGGRLLTLAPDTAKVVRTSVYVPYMAMLGYSAARSSLYLAATNTIAAYSADPKDLVSGSSEGTTAERPTASDYFASSFSGRSQLAVSGDGQHLVTPSSSGGLVFYSLSAPDRRYLYVLGAQLVESIPDSSSLLYVTGVYGHARMGVYDPQARKGRQQLVDMGPVSGKQPSAFNARLRLVAVASTDGLVRLRQVKAATFSFGSAIELTGPAGQRASVTLFDDPHRELYAAWAHEIRVYSLARPTQPELRYSITLPDTERVVAVSAAPGRKRLFVATDQHLYALPYRAGRYAWAHRVLLSSGVFMQAKALEDGGVVASTLTGALAVYRPRDDVWTELPLAGKGDSIGVVQPYGREIVVTVPYHIAVYDGRTGAQIVDMEVRYLLPPALNYNGSAVRTFGDTSSAITFPLSKAAVLTRACDLLGKSAPATVVDTWPDAPESVRGKPLCGADAR
ncbi:WD40 repeat domain-containing protein [Streptomyces sp. CA-210063]|uniref:WD40 repeat domain-containing protein n=1 Tax=Streptomyces sp. CA-210063 TaxID=2801029 RepID=UPI00214C1E47|nr:WD40 repeat domain-containing protein [Streptomyces sp. CA-210063]UUU28523.1 WD40 repeat domain-containing protein [Streptomyces sp. CA-210063]